MDIFCKHRNAVFSEEWTATKAPRYGFVYRRFCVWIKLRYICTCLCFGDKFFSLRLPRDRLFICRWISCCRILSSILLSSIRRPLQSFFLWQNEPLLPMLPTDIVSLENFMGWEVYLEKNIIANDGICYMFRWKICAVFVSRGSEGDDSDIEMLEERGPLQNADNNQASTHDLRNRSSANRSTARPSTVSQNDDNR